MRLVIVEKESGLTPVLALHVMMIYSDVEIEIHVFVAPVSSGTGQLQASIAGCTASVGNWMWLDVMQKKEI